MTIHRAIPLLHGTTKTGLLLDCTDQTVRNKIRRGELLAFETSTGRKLVPQTEIDRLKKEKAAARL